MTTTSDTSQDSTGVTTQTFDDGRGNENVVQTYPVSIGQAPLDIDPTAASLPSGEYVVNLDIANIDHGYNSPTTPGDLVVPAHYDSQNGFSDYYTLSLQYGQGTASLIATSQSTGVTSTVATVHDVATVLINGQWQPSQGPIPLYALGSNGFDLDTGPKILTDQAGGTTGEATLALSGNVVNYLPDEYYNFADGETVSIADNGVQVGSATIHSVNVPGTQRYLGPNDTAWAAKINLTPGTNDITITTTDANGLTGSASLAYTYTPSTGTTTPGSGTGSGGGATNPSAPVKPSGDAVAINPNVTFFEHGVFVLTGTASSSAGIGQVELSALVNGVETDLGAAKVNADGSFAFRDVVGAHVQSQITATLTDNAGGTAAGDAGFTLHAGIQGKPYVAQQSSFDRVTDVLDSTTQFHADGTRTVILHQPDQTLSSTWLDTFLNGGLPGNTFVFNPGYDADAIAHFVVGGAGHDTLSLPASDFASVADILGHAQQTSAGTVIHDPASGDTLQLGGVSKAALAHNTGDLTLHA